MSEKCARCAKKLTNRNSYDCFNRSCPYYLKNLCFSCYRRDYDSDDLSCHNCETTICGSCLDLGRGHQLHQNQNGYSYCSRCLLNNDGYFQVSDVIQALKAEGRLVDQESSSSSDSDLESDSWLVSSDSSS